MVVINIRHFNTDSPAIIGNIMALVAGFAMGGYLVIGRKLHNRIDPGLYIVMVYGISSVFLISGALLMGDKFTGLEFKAYLYMLAIAIVPQFIGHSRFNLSVRHLSATVVSVAILGEPMGASILA
ncbi:MAG: DMT family transporter [Dehalococcoidales bacterium]|jgi:drug/metabolite transporter (DMT)-like permease|nr:DMT family transporter [Dehalococcoidales bacterium]MDX9986336.1 DMT family transporter [Dehalococcoidales bacterium]NLE90736.1 DMT family transporter [Dehalococcoidales bacterium]